MGQEDFFRISRHTCHPSSPGSIMSSKIRSGPTVSNIFRAVSPSLAMEALKALLLNVEPQQLADIGVVVHNQDLSSMPQPPLPSFPKISEIPAPAFPPAGKSPSFAFYCNTLTVAKARKTHEHCVKTPAPLPRPPGPCPCPARHRASSPGGSSPLRGCRPGGSGRLPRQPLPILPAPLASSLFLVLSPALPGENHIFPGPLPRPARHKSSSPGAPFPLRGCRPAAGAAFPGSPSPSCAPSPLTWPFPRPPRGKSHFPLAFFRRLW